RSAAVSPRSKTGRKRSAAATAPTPSAMATGRRAGSCPTSEPERPRRRSACCRGNTRRVRPLLSLHLRDALERLGDGRYSNPTSRLPPYSGPLRLSLLGQGGVTRLT